MPWLPSWFRRTARTEDGKKLQDAVEQSLHEQLAGGMTDEEWRQQVEAVWPPADPEAVVTAEPTRSDRYWQEFDAIVELHLGTSEPRENHVQIPVAYSPLPSRNDGANGNVHIDQPIPAIMVTRHDVRDHAADCWFSVWARDEDEAARVVEVLKQLVEAGETPHRMSRWSRNAAAVRTATSAVRWNAQDLMHDPGLDAFRNRMYEAGRALATQMDQRFADNGAPTWTPPHIGNFIATEGSEPVEISPLTVTFSNDLRPIYTMGRAEPVRHAAGRRRVTGEFVALEPFPREWVNQELLIQSSDYRRRFTLRGVRITEIGGVPVTDGGQGPLIDVTCRFTAERMEEHVLPAF